MREAIPHRLLASLIALAVCAFIYGFLTSEIRLPPYHYLRAVVDWGRDQPQVRRVHDFLRGRHSDLAVRIRGAWEPVPDRDRARLPADQEERRRGFAGVGYLSGYEPGQGLAGVTVHDPDLAYRGFNLITSGHAQEAKLIDMEGRVLHRWSYNYGDAFPEYKDVETRFLMRAVYPDYWRRAHLFANGDILAVYEGLGLVKLDRDSRLLWKVEAGCHHDVFVDDDGLIYALGRELKSLPQFDPHGKLLEDFFITVDPGGRILTQISLVEAFEQSSFAPLLCRRQPYVDILHTNTVQVLDGLHVNRADIFKKGNVVISARNIDAVAILDPSKEKIVWALCGLWKAQHEPTLLTNGNMLVFDNQGNAGMSQVLELDPLTQKIVWAYRGTPENGFLTEQCGSAHRLPNGNTLIIESEAGRAFEVTPSKQIVWEYYNPERAGEDDELIATLFDVVRLSADFPLDWLDPAGSEMQPRGQRNNTSRPRGTR